MDGRREKLIPILRLLEIDRCLRSQNQRVTTETLAATLGVDVRTVRRDLKLLRERFGAPIVFDRKKRGLRYSDLDYTGPVLPALELRTLAWLVGNYLEGSPIGYLDPDWSLSAVNLARLLKIGGKNGKSAQEWVDPLILDNLDRCSDGAAEIVFYDSEKEGVGRAVLEHMQVSGTKLISDKGYIPLSRVHFVRPVHLGDADINEQSRLLPSGFPPFPVEVAFVQGWRDFVLAQEIFQILKHDDEDRMIRVIFRVNSSCAFIMWVLGFAGGARILSPKAFVQLYRMHLADVIRAVDAAEPVGRQF